MKYMSLLSLLITYGGVVLMNGLLAMNGDTSRLEAQSVHLFPGEEAYYPALHHRPATVERGDGPIGAEFATLGDRISWYQEQLKSPLPRERAEAERKLKQLLAQRSKIERQIQNLQSKLQELQEQL